MKLSGFAKTLMRHVHLISLYHGMWLVVELPFELLYCIVYCVVKFLVPQSASKQMLWDCVMYILQNPDTTLYSPDTAL